MFAYCASARIRADGPWAQPPFTLVAIYAAIVLAPATAYLYLAYPDWSWLYLVDSRRVPRLFVVPAVTGAAAALLGGWYAVARLISGRVPPRQVLAALAGTLLVGVALATLLRDRLFHHASYPAYHAGEAVSLFAVKLGYVLVAMGVGMGAAAAHVAWVIWRDGRRASPR